MNVAEHARSTPHLMLHLLVAGPSLSLSPSDLFDLGPSLLGSIQAMTGSLVSNGIEDVRGLLDVALEGLECEVSAENLRRLLERADDALAALQGWTTLAANARTCLEHPALRGGGG
jgi:hypothetical protein